MSTTGAVFTTRKGHAVRYLMRHQDIQSDFWYVDTESGREFDVRELPDEFIGADRTGVFSGDRDAHRRSIQRALAAGYTFNAKTWKSA